jgi:hypothetical protein
MGLSDAGMALTVSEGSSGASAGRAWSAGSTSKRPRADYIRMILGCGRFVVPCQFRGRVCGRVHRRSSEGIWISRNLDGTPSLVSKRPEKYRQVSGRRACAWMAVCKTVGLAYVGSNPTPATSETPGHLGFSLLWTSACGAVCLTAGEVYRLDPGRGCIVFQKALTCRNYSW